MQCSVCKKLVYGKGEAALPKKLPNGKTEIPVFIITTDQAKDRALYCDQCKKIFCGSCAKTSSMIMLCPICQENLTTN